MRSEKIEYLDFYKSEFGVAKHCTKSFGYAVWQHQQSKVDELQKRVCAVQRLIEDWREWSKNNQSHEACIYVEESISELDQALKGGIK